MKWNLLALSLYSSFCIAQKEYAFDYMLEYEINYPIKKTAKKSKLFYMTNSKNNDYIADYIPKDSLTFSFLFIDYQQYNTYGYFPQKGFLQSENIFISCDNINKQTGIPSEKKGKYGVNVLKDSLIDGVTYGVFEYRYLDKKLEKRKKLNHTIYVVDKNTLFHKPIRHHYRTTVESELQKLPNGIVAKSVVMSYDNVVISEEKLIRYVKIDKKIKLEICD